MRKAIAIDFDGCLCTDAFPAIGKPNWDVVNRAKQEQRDGAGLILWTCREGDLLEAAVDACWDWGLTFDAINESLPDWIKEFNNRPRKVGASEYWDDKAVQLPATTGNLNPNDRLTTTELRYRTEPVWCSCATFDGKDGFWCLCDHGFITTPSLQTFEVGEITGWELYPYSPHQQTAYLTQRANKRMDALRDKLEKEIDP